MNNYELYHFGKKGMKWGQRKYQNQDGSLTPLGRIHYGIGKGRQNGISALTKLEIKRKAAAKKKAHTSQTAKKPQSKKSPAQLEKEKKAQIEAQRKKVLASRSAKELYDNAHLFTTEELRAAKTRLELERDIKALEPKKVSKGQMYAEKINNVGITVNKLMGTGIGLWNNVARLYNSLTDNGRENPLPIIKDKGDQSMTSKAKAARQAKEAAAEKAARARAAAEKAEQSKNAKAQKAAEKAEKQAAKAEKQATKAEKKAEKEAGKNEKKSSNTSGPFTGIVEGVGRSKAEKFFNDNIDDFIDGVFSEVNYSSASNSPYKSIGQNYVTYLLEDKRRR